MKVAISDRLSITLIVLTFYVIFLTYTTHNAYSNNEIKITGANNNSYEYGLYTCKVEILYSMYILEDGCVCIPSPTFSLKDEYCDQNSHDITLGHTRITHTIKYNEFVANSLKEALTNSKVPGRDGQGMTQVRYNTSWFENNRGIVTYAEVHVIIEIQLPLWTNLESQCSNVIEEWNNFNHNLLEHEQTHRDIFEKFYKDIHKRVIGKTAEEVNKSILPKWNKTTLLNKPAIFIDQIQENYHQEMKDRGLHPIPVDISIRCDND